MAQPPKQSLAWQDSPDPFRPLMIPIYSPKVDRAVNAVVVCPSLVGVKIHYYDQRSRPHIEPRDLCEGCQRSIDLRWKGYLGCWDRHRGRLCLVEVTHEAYERCASFKEYKGQLRGMVIQLARNGASRNARVTAKLSLYSGPGSELPAAFNVQEALERIWFTHGGTKITTEEFLEGKRPEDLGDKLKIPDLFKEEGPYAR